MNETSLKAVADKILSKPKNVAFTGAGISTESGIPDFRSPGGIWERFNPMEYATIEAFRRDPVKAWEMFRELSRILEEAEPNPAHLALARLEELGLLQAVITQNIDNLHQEAGSKKVVEFHGNARRLVCECGKSVEAEMVKIHWLEGRDFPPRCESCGAIMKPDVVLFGEPIPRAASQKAMSLAQHPNVFLVVGTSAVVAPASYLPVVANKTGGCIVEINLEPTDLATGYAEHSLYGPAGEILPALLELVEAGLGSST